MNKENTAEHEEIFGELIKERSMLVQEYQESISSKGEVSYMVIGGKFTHAVLKKGKGQDFRVQENFGGTVHDYSPTAEEIAFAQLVVKKARSGIIYARVDVMWDNDNKLSLGELEVFEPALWLRKNPKAAEMLADIILEIVKKSN
jgi:glutathione synthase/RimK-type ligase-like ATP-grasp enzyme